MQFDAIQYMVFQEYKKNGYLESWTFLNNKLSHLYIDKVQTIFDLAEIGLINTEIAEAQEILRESNIFINKQHVLGLELADIVIRVMNFCSRKGINLESAIIEKHEINFKRDKLHGKKI
jgi:NTP pyrophosphatase (non-canonical NTP hydrolase)